MTCRHLALSHSTQQGPELSTGAASSSLALGWKSPLSHPAAATHQHTFPLLPPSLHHFNNSWVLSAHLETCLAERRKKKSTEGFLAQAAAGSQKPARSLWRSPDRPWRWITDVAKAIRHPSPISLTFLDTQGTAGEDLWADRQEDFGAFP